MTAPTFASIHFGADGLIPTVVQDADSDDVLMLAFMNDEALRRTMETGRAHYWSRSRGKLWRKGETSGNEQMVEEIKINCEQNSLLLRVRQIGAVCHDGFDTCFYRALNEDGSLTVVRERAFDPAQVYGTARSAGPAEKALTEASQRQYDAYVFLREHDLEAVSGTSRRLRRPEVNIAGRIADELQELAGVLEGTHRHGEPEHDLRLEASQLIYWVLLMAVREGIAWGDLRPDRALVTADETLDPGTVARMLTGDARSWQDPERPQDMTARAHATLALVGQACRSGGVDPLHVVLSDMAELRSRPYLQPFFSPEAV